MKARSCLGLLFVVLMSSGARAQRPHSLMPRATHVQPVRPIEPLPPLPVPVVPKIGGPEGYLILDLAPTRTFCEALVRTAPSVDNAATLVVNAQSLNACVHLTDADLQTQIDVQESKTPSGDFIVLAETELHEFLYEYYAAHRQYLAWYQSLAGSAAHKADGEAKKALLLIKPPLDALKHDVATQLLAHGLQQDQFFVWEIRAGDTIGSAGRVSSESIAPGQRADRPSSHQTSYLEFSSAHLELHEAGRCDVSIRGNFGLLPSLTVVNLHPDDVAVRRDRRRHRRTAGAHSASAAWTMDRRRSDRAE